MLLTISKDDAVCPLQFGSMLASNRQRARGWETDPKVILSHWYCEGVRPALAVMVLDYGAQSLSFNRNQGPASQLGLPAYIENEERAKAECIPLAGGTAKLLTCHI